MDAREMKDLEVSRYYMSTGNFQAAYLRAKDALAIVPDDPLAHFALAESAHRLKKKDEAVAEYKLYLQLEPDGTQARAAKRGLQGLVQE